MDTESVSSGVSSSTPSVSSINVHAGSGRILGLSISDWIKIVAFVLIVIIVASIIRAFVGALHSPAF